MINEHKPIYWNKRKVWTTITVFLITAFIILALKPVFEPNGWQPPSYSFWGFLYFLPLMAMMHYPFLYFFSMIKNTKPPNIFKISAGCLLWIGLFIGDYEFSTSDESKVSNVTLKVTRVHCRTTVSSSVSSTHCFEYRFLGIPYFGVQRFIVPTRKISKDIPVHGLGLLTANHVNNTFLTLGGYFKIVSLD